MPGPGTILSEERIAVNNGSPTHLMREFRNSLGLSLIAIPPGRFVMGSSPAERVAYDDEFPAHEVEIDQPFWLGKFPVTQDQYELVMGENPSRFLECGGTAPVENVTYDQATEFCRRLTELDSRTAPGRVYRLPCEAEWEYACRAGTTWTYGSCPTAEFLEKYAWYADNSGNRTHGVGQKRPNAWNLFDMLGNVWEWCADYYRLYSSPDDDQRPDAGHRVYRGPGWYSPADRCRPAYRYRAKPHFRESDLGFRVAASQE